MLKCNWFSTSTAAAAFDHGIFNTALCAGMVLAADGLRLATGSPQWRVWEWQ